MRHRESFTLLISFAIVIIVIAMMLFAFNLIEPPPMTGHVSGKDCHPAYYPVDGKTPTVFVLAITDDSGKRCASWIVSEERWNLYEVGDPVEWMPRFKEES